MRREFGAIAFCSLLIGCGDGVSVDGQSVSAGEPGSNSSLAVNRPAQSAIEPHARDWIGTQRNRLAVCGGLAQSAADAFATDGFSRERNAADEPFLVARNRVQLDTPEYIEFCVQVPELASYGLVARVLAPDGNQDSFFITVDEDAPGTLPEPFIYDVKRSDDGFIDDVVGARSQDPLTLVLDAGEHVLRFYYRERNTALAGIRLERQSGANGGGPDARSLAGCAANTGLSEARVSTLVERHLGRATPVFSLQGVPLTFTSAGEIEARVQRVNWSFDTGATRANVLCLSEPPSRAYNLIANTVSENRLVIGSNGSDRMRIGTPLRGTLIGNGGDDRVEVLDSGLFIGGAGDDSVARMTGDEAVFSGGEGSDLVRVMEAGRFDGEAGDDRLLTQFGGTFDGGPGNDTVERQSGGALATNVETTGVGFEPLAPPTEPRLVDATTTGGVLRWTASADTRIDGYVVTVARENDTTDPNDLGASPESVSLRVTTRPVYVLDRVDPFAPLIRVHAFQRLDDGSTLYSEPATLTFAPGRDTDYLVEAERIAERQIDERFLQATLADDGSVVVAYESSNPGPRPPAFSVFDGTLQSERRVLDEALDDRRSLYLGRTRQYAVPTPSGDVQATAVAYDGNVSQRLWERDVTVPVDLPFQEFQRCLFALVTQDDWLICSRIQGGSQAFDPQGNARPLDDVDLLVEFSLIDGDGGRLAVVEDENARPFQGLTRIDTDAGTTNRVAVDLSAQLQSGDVETEVLGLAVRGDEAILSGAILAERCDDECSLVEGERTAYFLARVSLSTGQVLAWQRLPLDERPGTGIGKLTPDRASVVFTRQNLMTRYDASSLATLERRGIPGVVAAVGDDAVLVQDRLFSEQQPGLQTGSRFYLLTR